MSPKRRYKRGYPVALLVGFEENYVVIWQIFSQVVKKFLEIELEGNRTVDKELYNFHESIIESLKPALKEGTRTIALTSSAKTTYTQDFLDHVNKHHRYLIQSKNPNRANFTELVGSADDQIKVAELTKTKEFTESISETTSEEADQIINRLEKHLYHENGSIVLYTLKEIEDWVYPLKKDRKTRKEYLILTDRYLTDSKQKNRIHRLMQISRNKKVKTKVVNAETSAGNRISQFGGIIFFAIPTT